MARGLLNGGRSTCWICGNPAQSREHSVKKSNIKRVYGIGKGEVDLYYHTGIGINSRIKSINSDILKWPDKICSTCNNATTQPHDEAWDEMVFFLRDKESVLRPGCPIYMSEIYGGNYTHKVGLVNLYLCKQLGCAYKKAGRDDHLADFSKSILSGVPCADLYIRLGVGDPIPGHSAIGYTDLVTRVDPISDEISISYWSCFVGKVVINVVFFKNKYLWGDEVTRAIKSDGKPGYTNLVGFLGGVFRDVDASAR